MYNFQPLPVHDFGNNRLTLTDGHSRAYTAYKAGCSEIPVCYDFDDIVTSAEGQLLYKNDLVWCERFGLKSACDLEKRIVSMEMYQKLWIQRCDVGYNLLIEATASQRAQWKRLNKNLFLYGVSDDFCTLYFEDVNGTIFEVPIT